MNPLREMNDDIDRTLKRQARILKRRAALMTKAAAELETEAETVLALAARYRAPGVDLEALLRDVLAYHQQIEQKASARWTKFVEDFNAAAAES